MPATVNTWPEDINVRPIAVGEIECFLDVFDAAWGFARDDEQRRHTGTVVAAERPFGAFADGDAVGTVMSFALELTVPGQLQVPMAGVSYVAVHPLRRRRGVLRALMRSQLDDLHARGVPLAGLGPARRASTAGSGTGPRHLGQLLAAGPRRRALTGAAYRSLWAHLAGLDLTDQVIASGRPEHEPLRWALADSRQLVVTGVHDHLWLRLVDLPAALSRRRYAAEGALVLDVTDPFCPWNEGRWLLEGGPDGATCRTAGHSPAPSLRLDATAQSSLR
jgi:predicted acetyltransferase